MELCKLFDFGVRLFELLLELFRPFEFFDRVLFGREALSARIALTTSGSEIFSIIYLNCFGFTSALAFHLIVSCMCR